MEIQGIYKKDDCVIKNCSFTYTTGQSQNGAPMLLISMIGISTEIGVCPNEQDGFEVNIKTPPNITTIGDEGLEKYIKLELSQYKI